PPYSPRRLDGVYPWIARSRAGAGAFGPTAVTTQVEEGLMRLSTVGRSLFGPKPGLACRPSLLALVLGLWAAPAAHAQAIAVDRSDDDPAASACTAAPSDCSLRGAVAKAAATPGTDLITVPAGSYPLLGQIDIDSNVTIEGPASGTALLFFGTPLDARVLDVHAATTVKITHLTIAPANDLHDN